MTYEITTDEYKEEEPKDYWGVPLCGTCGRPKGYHWQTAEGKIFCTREVTQTDGEVDANR